MKKAVAEWLDDVCTGGWRLDYVHVRLVDETKTIPCLVFDKNTDKEIVRIELIEKPLDDADSDLNEVAYNTYFDKVIDYLIERGELFSSERLDDWLHELIEKSADAKDIWMY